MGFNLLNTSCCDVQVQMIRVPLNRNTFIAEESEELIDLASRGERTIS